VADFCGRRRRLANATHGAPILLASGPITYRSRDTRNVFRPDSDFHYLTGFPDPGAVALLCGERFLLFASRRDPGREVWDGETEGLERAADFGAEPREIDDLARELLRELAGKGRIYVSRGRDERLDRAVADFLGSFRARAIPDIADASVPIGELRAVKDAGEIERMSRAARISARAHEQARGALRPGLFEYELEAILLHEFRAAGASGPAYPPIVASGVNATTLHYTLNAAKIEEADLVLIDAGAECDFYAADITRTWSARGPLSGEAGAVHAAVSEAQEAALARCVPGRTLGDVEAAAHEVLARALSDWGVLSTAPAEILDKGLQKPYTIHRTSHFLGLDVHDPAPAVPEGSSPVLLAGMVITVEPGLYFRTPVPAPAGFARIGVRIEDDVLITEGPARVLSR
jgi:Xaa-Pro aminopeptidase